MSDTAIASIVTGVVTIVTMVVGFLTLWVKMKYSREADQAAAREVVEKIDDNTAITRAGATAAVNSARNAANTATEVKHATQSMAQSLERKLNGGIDSAIEKGIVPIQATLEEHKARIDDIEKYIHERNHDVLNALHTQNLKLEALLAMVKGGQAAAPR